MLALLLLIPGAMAQDVAPWQRVLAAVGGVDNFTPAQWNSMSIVERLLNYDWLKEILILSTLTVYVLFYVYGINRNKSLVDGWMSAVRPVLIKEFAEIGAEENREVIKDSPSHYTTYATGRVNVESMLAHFHLTDRQNIILQSAALVVPSFASTEGIRDRIDVTITPMSATAIEPVIFSVVNKDIMQKSREENYFLSLTKTSDSDKLPKTFVFMTEHNDAIDTLFTPEFKALIEGSEDVLEYIAVTDQRRDAPQSISDVIPRTKVYVSFKYPHNEKQGAKVAAILDFAINFVDFMIEKKPLKVEAAKKIKATRAAEVEKLRQKEDVLKQEALESKKAEERRQADIAFSKLPEKEQRRLAKKQQEKEARKQQKKATRRG